MPDLLVGWMGETFLFEVKNRQGRGVKLSDAEAHFVANWKGSPVVVVETPEQALAALQARRAS